MVRRACRGVRRNGTVNVRLLLKRPLNEESCYVSVRTMHEEDYRLVRESLARRFTPKGLVVQELKLQHVRKVSPQSSPITAEPYGLVEATFVVTRSGKH